MSWAPRTLLVAALALVLAAPAPAAPEDQSMAGWSVDLLAKAKARMETLRENLTQAPIETRQALATARASLMSGTGVRSVTYLAILLFVGIGVEWLYWTYAYSSLRAIQTEPASTARQALRLGLRRLVLQGSGLFLFGIATIGTSAAFSWPKGVHELLVAATLLLLVLRLAWILLSIIVAPGRPGLRLVPVRPDRARRLAGVAMTVVLLLAIGHFVPDAINHVGRTHHAGGALRLVAFAAAALFLVIASFAFVDRPARATSSGRLRLPVFPRSFVLALMVIAVYVVWLMTAAAAIAAIVAVVIALQLCLRDVVFFLWRDADEPKAPGAGSSDGKGSDGGVLPSIILSAARFTTVLLGVGACALALDTAATALVASESPVLKIGLRLVGVATLALLTHVIWIGVRTVIDRRLAMIGPGDPHNPPDASSRLLTLLPLLRVTTAVVLLVMLILSSLWALGIEITPLLAGAGVVGIALGFGAQALVRDVIAGIFFLAEDAFRIGEYIESGANTKGTVERITLRTVALRHHNGPLHFVPYGSLGTVRNTSRDWVIDKFNLPLPIDVESEKIRKMIKKVGEDMQADPVIGALMMEPLKGKLYKIDPGVKIFRCKFRSAPGKQFDVRASALKRIEAALKEMGVGFADGRQTLIMQPLPA